MPAVARVPRDRELRRLLTEKGIRVTEQRMTLLNELSRLRTPVSHPELTERLSDSSLDRATIYRNLVSLTEAGLLVRTQLGDHVWRYELPRAAAAQHGGHARHAHFVCTDCGDVDCLPENSVSFRGPASKIQVTEVQLRGLCASCAR